MSQAQALIALESYLVLSKSASSPATAADLITRATSDPQTFVFAELLETDSIKSLATSEKSAYHSVLKIFSYGTYQTYLAEQSNLPELNDAQRLKLRQLSLLTLAQDQRNLEYAKLMAALDLSSPHDLESTVISAVYAGLWDAVLNPKRQVVEVSSVAPLRDLAPDIVPPILDVLQQWSGRCTTALEDIEAEIARIQAKAESRRDHKDYHEANKAHTQAHAEAHAKAQGQLRKTGRGGIPLGRDLPQRLGPPNMANMLNRQAKRAQAAWDDINLGLEGGEEQKKRTSRRKL
ncbi:hypothetical protein BROUX41_000781 [Berkeleyomyces rouxiae]|uniref:uncharacterized protein n=1 Tax=Berkeleyomyces rouxiae TaxID=2035830 RepID=UPI003B76FCAA